MKTWPENRPTGMPAGTVQPLWTTTLGGRGPSGLTRSMAATEPSKREGRARRTASLTGPGGPRIALTSWEKENGYVRDEEDIGRGEEEGGGCGQRPNASQVRYNSLGLRRCT